MRTYLKILCSILVALILLYSAAVTISVLHALISGSEIPEHTFFAPFFVAFAGFVMFGISGSVLWFVFQRELESTKLRETARHAVSVTLAAPASLLLFGLLVVLGDSNTSGFGQDLLILSIYIVPVAATSMACYWWIYLKRARRDSKATNTPKRT